MTISKEFERLEKSALKLTLKVQQEDVRSKYDELLANYGKNLQIPGFRKGKVPKDVLIRKLGDGLKEEVLAALIEAALTEVFDDKSLAREYQPLPYSTPKLEDKPKLDTDADLTFSVIYDVLPKVTIGQWNGLNVVVPDAEITEEDINRELEQIRERNAMVFDKDEDAPAEENDVVTVDYSELDDEGNVIPGTEREDFVFTLGSGNNIFKFDHDIIGMKQGETKDIEKSYPEDFADKDLAGKTKKIRVSLSALKEKSLPELDDDLAQDVDEKYATLDDLKNSLRESLQKNLDEYLRSIKINAIIEKIMENTPVDIPDSMIRVELDSRWTKFLRQVGVKNEQMADYIKNNPDSREAFIDKTRSAATKALHSRLIVETLMQDLALEASDEDIEKELENIAKQHNEPLEDVREYYEQKEEAKEYLIDAIKEKKLYDRFLAENNIEIGGKKKYPEIIGSIYE
ncbi:MAG: trigger factor [Treponema sp.]|nr:trigger factor [Treponema sp.]